MKEEILGYCANCGKGLKESEIFEGIEESYICSCGFEGYNWNKLNKIKQKGK